MLIKMRRNLKNAGKAFCGEKGFTLIELIIVVAIIGLLAAVALPNLLSRRQAAQEAVTREDLKSAATDYYAKVVEDDLANFDATIYGVRVVIPYRSNWGIFWLGKNNLFINQSGRIIGIFRPLS